MNQAELDKYRARAEQTAREQRAIQKWINSDDARAENDSSETDQSSRRGQSNGNGTEQQAVQAGDRLQPESPLPEQHHAKPGKEANLRPLHNY